ncbi:hypothetical protein SBA4_2340006 [Candidatus Sulfopaludibacter sp. SbA4]|nr:hypothetical protein SBA4_2340006 [Candidatus Sulfopaludibacter sp. SbA4]
MLLNQFKVPLKNIFPKLVTGQTRLQRALGKMGTAKGRKSFVLSSFGGQREHLEYDP